MQPLHVLQTSAKLLSAGERSTDDRPSQGFGKCRPEIATPLPFVDSLISTIPSHVQPNPWPPSIFHVVLWFSTSLLDKLEVLGH